MKHVLITGGGGYIGTVLTEELLSRQYKVTCLDRFFFGSEKIEPFISSPHYHWVKDDIRTVSRDVLEGVDVVIDLAALSNDPLGELVQQETIDINCNGRLRMCELAKKEKVSKYILASSCSVYGFNENWCDESSALNPVSTYAKASADAEQCLSQAANNFSVTVLRFATVFGVSNRMRFDLAVNLMTLRAFKDGMIYVLGQGMQWRPFVHVRDVAQALLHVIEADAEKVNCQIFNVGSNDHNRKIINLAYTVREVLPFEIAIKIAPDDADKRSYRVNFDKISETLGYASRHSIEDGIREVYNALKQGDVWDGPDTVTVKWYKYLLDAHATLQQVMHNGSVL